MSNATTWQPQVEQRAHPLGEMGVRSSLEEVARRAAAGGVHPRVRSWAIEQIHYARQQGKKVSGDRTRAEILLQTVQRNKTWVPDPVGAEYIPGAHLLACNLDDEDGPCLKGDDCDGLVVLFAACCLSVGLHTMIVGHAYNQEQNIQHVLAAVRINGTWMYADPSYDFALGKCEPFTRERLLSIPNVQVICDSTSCLSDATMYDPDRNGSVSEGLFVGVNGRREQWRVEWLGQAPVSQQAYDSSYAAAQKEADRQAATGKFDAKAIVQAGGAGAAAGACVAIGAAAASPICASIGAAVAGWVADAVKQPSLSSGFFGEQVTNARVRLLRKTLANEDWSEAQAKSYLDKLTAPCRAIMERIIKEKGSFDLSVAQYKPVQDCLNKQSAKMLAEFTAVGASKKTVAASRSGATSTGTGTSTTTKVVAAAAAGAFLWWLLA